MQALGIDVLFKETNLLRLLQRLWIAVQISGISVALSLVLGVLVGIFMMWQNTVARAVSRLYLEIVRIMPQLALLYIVFFGATRVLGVNLTAEFSAIIVFTFWDTGEMGDLVRGALASTPRTSTRAPPPSGSPARSRIATSSSRRPSGASYPPRSTS